MFNLSLFYKKNMDSNHPQNANLIMIAGKTVAVGGFYLTQEYIDNAQISSYFATNHRPYRYFDQTELDEAALKSEKIGNTPWQNSWFKFKSDLSVIAPKYLSYEMLWMRISAIVAACLRLIVDAQRCAQALFYDAQVSVLTEFAKRALW